MWHYRMRHRILNGKDWYDIVEFYPGLAEEDRWTVNGMKPGGETPTECLEAIELMLADARKYPILDDITDGEAP